MFGIKFGRNKKRTKIVEKFEAKDQLRMVFAAMSSVREVKTRTGKCYRYNGKAVYASYSVVRGESGGNICIGDGVMRDHIRYVLMMFRVAISMSGFRVVGYAIVRDWERLASDEVLREVSLRRTLSRVLGEVGDLVEFDGSSKKLRDVVIIDGHRVASVNEILTTKRYAIIIDGDFVGVVARV